MIRRAPNKFRAVRVTNDGRSFMSKGESSCYDYLKLLEASGELKDLKCQVSVRLTQAELRWVLDFSYVKDGKLIFADFKGMETERWLILKKLWPYYGPGILEVYKGKGLRMFIAETIVPR